jgi:arylsulfatase A-like enzyme
MSKKSLFLLIFLSISLGIDAQTSKPNIILIMVDDMGWSDIGCYGGEIQTPHIDALAKNGLRFKQFYNTARCCPTRASLLTGLYSHQAGIGQMAEDPENADAFHWGTPGYQGFLNRNCVTIAEVLKGNGYHTYMTGKWHVGMHGAEKRPLQRGFERYYGILAGATSYFKPRGGRGLWLDNQAIDPPNNPNYYTTDAFTDYALSFLKEQKDGNPYFLYIAYNAPHWPLHAKKADIEKYKNAYLKGWDVVRQERLKRQVDMGLVDPKFAISDRDKRVRAWEKLSATERDTVAYRMAVYAAQVHSVDENIGKLIAYLKEKKQLDNTLIMFLTDNGACAEVYQELGSQPFERINDPNYSGSVSYGIGWANASNTPFFEYKVKPYEGGIRTPFIAHFPNLIKKQKGKWTETMGTIRDVMPTILALTQTTYPTTFHNGQNITPLEGKSLLPTFKKGKQDNPNYLFWEHQNYGAVRKGNWKAVVDNNKTPKWELFDLNTDPYEQKNIADKQTVILEDLKKQWQIWANSHFVFPKKAN